VAPTIRKVRADDVVPLAAVEARAFFDDPLQEWVFPDESKRLDILRRMFEVTIRSMSMPLGESYTDDSRSVAALWAPPGKWFVVPEPGSELESMGEIVGDGMTRMRYCWEAMFGAHPEEPHFYLSGLGTDPPMQGRGYGSAALAPVLTRCDAERIPAYLESTKEKNVRFYEGHGFAVTRTIDLPHGGPSMWAMWRDPQTS
jgi:ribosomal protein S18 acetylase RimI-like enzyme